MPTKKQQGDAAEQQAQHFLEQQGCTFITGNFSCRTGEIDLIMRSAEQEILFVEVRYRKNNDYGGALESITLSKQNKIRNTALYYLQKHKLDDCNCRFDVIAITQDGDAPDIEWIENAF